MQRPQQPALGELGLPHDETQLLELPLDCLALVMGQLGTEGMLVLFQVSHTTRLLVLNHVHSVRLSPAPGARMHVMARILEVPPRPALLPST